MSAIEYYDNDGKQDDTAAGNAPSVEYYRGDPVSPDMQRKNLEPVVEYYEVSSPLPEKPKEKAVQYYNYRTSEATTPGKAVDYYNHNVSPEKPDPKGITLYPETSLKTPTYRPWPMIQADENHSNIYVPGAQPVVLYDTGKVYVKNSKGKLVKKTMYRRTVFDGVTKLEHKLSLTVEADPKNAKGAKYVNGAINNQNEVSMDIYMSNVYTVQNTYAYKKSDSTVPYEMDKDELKKTGLKPSGDRSGDLFNYLNKLKRDRRKIKVITPYVTYSNMLLAEIAIIQDDTVYNGWYGSLTFKESVADKGGGGKSSYTNPTSNESGGRIASWLVGVFGSHVAT